VKKNGGAAYAAPPFCIPPLRLRLPRRAIATTFPAVLGPVPHILLAVAAILGAVADIFARIAAVFDAVAAPTLVLGIADILAAVTAVLGAVTDIFATIATVLAAITTILDTVADGARRAGARGGCLRLAGGWGTQEGEGGSGDEQSAAHLVIS
jgi:hypothetical protein